MGARMKLAIPVKRGSNTAAGVPFALLLSRRTAAGCRKDGSVVTYVNEYRGRSETKPVLPSDHFGLMVTLKPK